MRVREFFIRKYGPLVELGRFTLGDFNLFFGMNEEGKTLIIDAIVRFLFKKGKKIFREINRVDETPEGYLIMENGTGETFKFPEKGELTELTGLSVGEYRNIFIIRSSDLSIDEENIFYRNVQDKLTGLRTDEIGKIKNNLLEIGRLAPKGDFRNIKGEKLGERLEKAKKHTESIEELKKDIEEKGFEKLEEELFKNKKGVEDTEGKLKIFENAEKRERYEKGIASLDSLNKVKKELNELEQFSEEEENQWRDSERDIKNSKKDKKALETELTQKNKEKEVKEQTLRKKSNEFTVFKNRKKKLEEDINPEITDYERRSQEIAKGKAILTTIKLFFIFFAVLFLISLAGFILRPAITTGVLLSVSGISTIILIILIVSLAVKKRTSAGSIEKIRLMTEKIGIGGDNIENIIYNREKFKEEYSKMDTERRDLNNDSTVLEREIVRIRKEIPIIGKEIESRVREIDKIRRKSGVETTEEYNKKLKRLEELKKIKAKEIGILKSYFGKEGRTEEENIQNWQAKTEEYEQYKDKSTDTAYDEQSVSHLKVKRSTLIDEKKEIEKRMRIFTEELSAVERTANEVLKPSEEDYMHCNTTVDVKIIKERLESFIKDNEQKRKVVLNVKEIFEEIEKEEEEKVSNLFGENNPVSSHFKKITDGMYTNVEYDTEEKIVKVLQESGKSLNAEKLSSGAYDQLYLSIRLALGEKILKGEKGFFIMDDPFVKSDVERLKRQIAILKKLSHSGWQIIYFSAKNEVKECLKEEIKNGEISYFEI